MNARSTTRRSGFTLIEMLVVIAIIAILSSLLFPAVTKALETARRNKARVEAQSIAAAINVFFNDYGYFPIAFAQQSGNADVTPDTAEVIQTLLAIDGGDNAGHQLNPRRKVYLSLDRATSDCYGSSGKT